MAHVLRGNNILRHVLEEEMLRKRVRGRPRRRMIDEVVEDSFEKNEIESCD